MFTLNILAPRSPTFFDSSSYSVLDNKIISNLAEKITEEYYAEDKGAIKRWGPEGKKRVLEDTVFTLQHLSSAVFADDLNLFLNYFKWLIVVLTSRQIKLDFILIHTQIMIDILDIENKNKKIMMKDSNEGKKRRQLQQQQQQTLQKCIIYLKKGRSLLARTRKNPKIIENFSYHI